jgi:hypothetical protein
MSKPRLALILGICAALAVVGIIVAAAVKDSSSDEPKSSLTDEQVRIEIRSMPVANLRVDGKKVGKTPMVLQFPKSNREIKIEASMDMNIYDMRTRQPVGEPVVVTRTVKLDQDAVIDIVPPKQPLRPRTE